ncbi:MAG: hypothetical protein IR153_11710 [Flavobacterium sp.]|nr:hypothetical protein [Flavobacterium sp.]
MPENEKNNWDHANRQGENRDFNQKESDSMYLKKDDAETHEVNPNVDADGYGAESARSDHSSYDAGMGSRTGNKHHSDVVSSRSNEDLIKGNSGASGRSSGH